MPNTVKNNPSFPEISISNQIYERALKLIPSGTQTLAKGTSQFSEGIAPKYIHTAKGSHVWDVDGNEYIDFNMGIGPVILGYCYDKVDRAVINQLKSGITFSLMHPLEVQTAELISSIIPNAEAVRFAKNGCDVTTAAVRLARAYTGRDNVLCCGYHGWHDWYISVTDRNSGIPSQVQNLTYTFEYNNLDSLINALDDTVACVILEPVVFDEPQNNFLHKVKELCEKNGSILIFDEMWTGFRINPGGAQQYYGVNADLACFSKAVANGMPLSVLTGRKDIMNLLERDVFFFSTFGGETLSLAAANAVINEIIEYDVCSYISEQGAKIKHAYNSFAKSLGMNYTSCKGYNARTIISFNELAPNPLEIKTLMQQEMIKRGILWAGFHNICYSHSENDINYIIDAYEEILPIIANAVENNSVRNLIIGELVKPVFRKTEKFNTKPKNKFVA